MPLVKKGSTLKREWEHCFLFRVDIFSHKKSHETILIDLSPYESGLFPLIRVDLGHELEDV